MKNQLDKIIYFVKNTGDKVIVLKDDSEFVVIPLDDYESLFHQKKQLAALSEEEMLSRINREIALWRESQRALADLAEEDYDEEDYYDDDYEDHLPPSRLRDDDFYYHHLDEVGDDDRWVEPDWLEDEEDEGPFDEFDPEAEFDLPPELLGEDELFENKKGAEDVSLPWENEKPVQGPKPAAEQPVIQPKKKINNFGYPNPADTAESAQERAYGEDYDHIPPPPSR